MLKSLFLFLLGLLCFQMAQAQKPDSVLLYMTKSDEILDTKDGADHILLIMTPADSSTGTKINQVKEYYLNRQLKLTGNAAININGRQLNMLFQGPRIEYFENGHRRSVENFNSGKNDSDFTKYFPNGKLYQTGNRTDGILKLIECCDSTGTVLAENGNGKWIDLDDGFKNILLQGTVKDSLKEGEWEGMDSERVACVTTYKQGTFVFGTYYFRSGKKMPYIADEVEPSFDGGHAGFKAYLGKTVKYPDIDKKNGITGKVIVTFVVEKDGSLNDVKVLKSPSPTMADAVVQAIKLSPSWSPGIQYGAPVRVQYTIPFSFN